MSITLKLYGMSSPYKMKNANKLEKIEALRGLAAFYVVLHHAFPHKYIVSGFNVYNFFRFGQEAVILFFLLSGFVIKYSFSVSTNKTFKRYFFRRFFRLYIPLVIVMILGYLILSHKNGAFISLDFPNMIGNLFMLQDWAKVKPHVFFDPYLGNNPLWSLAYEWWFYMLFFPITAFIKNDSARNILVFSVSITAAIAYISMPYFPIRVVMYFAIWWAGVMLAEAYLKARNFTIKNLALPIACMLMIMLIQGIDILLAKGANKNLTFGFHPILELRHFSFALVAILMAFGWRHFKWFSFNTFVRPFAFFAPISYTIYILHWHVMIDAEFLNVVTNPIIRWFCYLAVLFALAYVIEIIVYPFVKNRFANLTR